MKKKKKASKPSKFVVRDLSGAFYFDDQAAPDIERAEKIAEARKVLYKGKYAIYELVKVVD